MLQEHSYECLDEGFWVAEKAQENCAWLINHLQQGRDCIVVEGAFMFESERANILSVSKKHVPDVDVEWICFENDQEKAAINIRKRPSRDPEGHVAQNRRTSARFTYPAGATIVPIITDPK